MPELFKYDWGGGGGTTVLTFHDATLLLKALIKYFKTVEAQDRHKIKKLED